jgi:hypothetical protein
MALINLIKVKLDRWDNAAGRGQGTERRCSAFMIACLPMEVMAAPCLHGGLYCLQTNGAIQSFIR